MGAPEAGPLDGLLDYAELQWRGRHPLSGQFGDIYYQEQDSWGESDQVYVHATAVPERFAGQHTTVIGEIGFGVGLNFFNTLNHFLARADAARKRLIYISCELHPLQLEDLRRLQADWPLADWRERFYAFYPHNRAGFHLLPLADNVQLLLLWGDVAATLPELDATVDCWYLDGFNPAQNPDCFSAATLAQLGRLSRPGTKLSTFSAAGAVRAALDASGWQWEKIPGHHKRHMLVAQWPGGPRPEADWRDRPPALARGSRVAIIGAGLAGLCTAAALRRDYELTVFSDGIPASAVPVAVPYVQLDADPTPARAYHLSAWLYAQRYYHDLPEEIYRPYPMIHRHLHPGQEEALRRLLGGDPVAAGVIHTALLRAELAADLRVRAERIDRLDRDGDGWRLAGERFDAVIVCTGWQTDLLDPVLAATVRPVAGQGTTFSLPTARLDRIECGEKTLIPVVPGLIYSGGSFHPNCSDTTLRLEDDGANARAVLERFPDVFCHRHSSFANVRGASRDYQPLVGPVPAVAATVERFAALRQDARALPAASLPLQPGLFVQLGLGSKAYSHAPLNGALLQALLLGTPLPLPRRLLAQLYPSRFVLRALRRRQL